MNTFLLCSLLELTYSIYLRNDAVEYARQNYNKNNHECGNNTDDYLKCSPFAYFGNEFCNYDSHGGDCANFVSQCLVYGGKHENLSGTANCRGYPCGFEEPGARKLGKCLQEKGWNSTCDKFMEPPIYIKPGDVLIYHESSCDSNPAHAVIITSIEPFVNITGRSKLMKDELYNYNEEKPYYQWLHYIDIDIDVDDYGKPLESYKYIITIKKVQLGFFPCSETIGVFDFYIYGDMNKDIETWETITINLNTPSDQKIEATCIPYYTKLIQYFICQINICEYPLNNIDIYLPIEPPISEKYGFINWKNIIGESPGISNKISKSKVTCLPKELNTFIPSSIKSEGCENKNKNIFTIYGNWMYDKEDKKPFFWDINLLILNGNNKRAYCEYNSFKSNMKCEYEGYGIIKFEEAYSTFINIFKMNEFSSSVELKDCSLSDDNWLNLSSHYLVFLISFIILLG